MRSPNLVLLLKRFRESGKQLFLLTNSHFSFANAVLTYLIGEKWQSALLLLLS
jgi:hypothetical protein